MEAALFPREEGFRQFVRASGRHYSNPYLPATPAHASFESGWREAARLCGQPLPAALLADTSLRAVVGRVNDRGLVSPAARHYIRSWADLGRLLGR